MGKGKLEVKTSDDLQYDDFDSDNVNDGTFYYGDSMGDFMKETTPSPVLNTTPRQHFYRHNVPELSELNSSKSESFLSIFILLGCIMVLGVLTNILVCYIYRCRARRATSNFLVIFFAICDFAGCLVGTPWVFSTLALPYHYNSESMCKIVGFVETCSVCSLCTTLLCAAYICYYQLCGGGGSVIRAKYYCAAALGVSVLISIPALVVYSVTPVKTSWPGIEGRSCGLDFNAARWLQLLYHILVLACFTVALAGMSVFYMLIFVSLYRQRQAECRGDKQSPAAKQFPKKHRFVREETSSSSVTATSYTEEIGRLHTARTQCHASSPHGANHHHHYHHHHSDPTRVPLRSGCESGGGVPLTGTFDRNVGRGVGRSFTHAVMKNSSSQQTSLLDNSCMGTSTATSCTPVSPVVQLNMKNTRQARIFSVISIIFVVFMLPYVVVTVLLATTNVFHHFSSDTTEVIVKLCLRSYFLNYLVKPVVYIIFNVSFREEVKRLFLKLLEFCPHESHRPRPAPPQNEAHPSTTPGTQRRQMRSISNSSIYRPAKTTI
ncbi:orexin receptor type 2 [Plakobranchus ocellatus]|uniref:Orexin receptor type 2 n=1 Tax=Plakobranchus ocellatus TaxID=259542 RepID=A0AAV4DTH1_9GAST|nr:orexin receptor type 2 [Plakobranchus ocellatus]